MTIQNYCEEIQSTLLPLSLNLIRTQDRISSLVEMVGKKTFQQMTITAGEIGFSIMTQKREIEISTILEDTVKNQLMDIYQVFERIIENVLTESYQQIDDLSDVDLMIKSFFGAIVIGSLSRLLVMIRTSKTTIRLTPEYSRPDRFWEKDERIIELIDIRSGPVDSEEHFRRLLRENPEKIINLNQRRRFGHQVCFFSGGTSFEEVQQREQELIDAASKWVESSDVRLKTTPPFVEASMSVRDTCKVIEKAKTLADTAVKYVEEQERRK